MNKSSATSPAKETATLLAISQDENDPRSLSSILERERWNVRQARSLREAAPLLPGENVSLIFCERDLHDGTWKDILQQASRLHPPPPIVVFCRHADERFWAEVLNLGGYDVLLKPFDSSEVRRVSAMALRYARRHTR